MKGDLFKTTETRLILLYSGLLILFLALFSAVVSLIIYLVFLNIQEREIGALAKEEAKFISESMIRGQTMPWEKSQDLIIAGGDQFFYYVVNPNGEVIAGDEAIESSRQDLLTAIQEWSPKENNTFKAISLRVTYPAWGDMLVRTEKIRLMMTGTPLSYRGQILGTLYIGKNISFVYDLFRWLNFVLAGLVALFTVVAFFVSRYMSKRAMVPVERAFKRQQEFVGDASHELRTPLSVMLTSINALEMNDTVKEDPFSRKMLATMKNEVKRMTKLVGDLLTLARTDSGTMEKQVEAVNLREMADKVVQTLRPLAVEKQIQLKLTAPEHLFIQGDRARLEQLLIILLDNAIKYTTTGGEAELSLGLKHQRLEIKVRDNGIGIAEEDMTRIFDRFYRADKARSRQSGGHGLGLSIAKWIVELHQGTISVESELGQGTTFIVNIPKGDVA